MLHYLTDPADAPNLDILILPGTKNTVADLRWLRQAGWENYLARHLRRGGWVVGVCGGYQMLGRRILDPDGIESESAATTGLALLDVESSFQRDKVTARVKATEVASGLALAGYEIHAGRVTRAESTAGRSSKLPKEKVPRPTTSKARSPRTDARSAPRSMGCSTRRISPQFSQSRARRQRAAAARRLRVKLKAVRERAYDQMADVAAQHLDLRRLLALAGIT